MRASLSFVFSCSSLCLGPATPRIIVYGLVLVTFNCPAKVYFKNHTVVTARQKEPELWKASGRTVNRVGETSMLPFTRTNFLRASN